MNDDHMLKKIVIDAKIMTDINIREKLLILGKHLIVKLGL